jgi:hypothetical protein
MADQKTLGALLSGIARREFHGDAEMTNEFLAEQLFGGDTGGAFVYVQSITRPSNCPLLELVALRQRKDTC